MAPAAKEYFGQRYSKLSFAAEGSGILSTPPQEHILIKLYFAATGGEIQLSMTQVFFEKPRDYL